MGDGFLEIRGWGSQVHGLINLEREEEVMGMPVEGRWVG